MELLFWSCLAGGAIFALISVIFGEILEGWIDGILDVFSLDFLQPMVLASAVTVFGGAGLLLLRYTELAQIAVLVLSILIALLIAIIIYFAYVKPMQNSENSTGFSVSELPGKLGEVTIPIPAGGFGEVMVNFVSGNTLHIASSWDQQDIAAGELVVVVEAKGDYVQVSRLYEKEDKRELM